MNVFFLGSEHVFISTCNGRSLEEVKSRYNQPRYSGYKPGLDFFLQRSDSIRKKDQKRKQEKQDQQTDLPTDTQSDLQTDPQTDLQTDPQADLPTEKNLC